MGGLIGIAESECSTPEQEQSPKDKDIGFLPAKRQSDPIDLDAVSFDVLEQNYQERKRQKLTVDLTIDSDDDADDKTVAEPDGSGAALRNQIKQNEEHASRLVEIKKEKTDAQESLKEATESLEDTKEDLEDANELVQQQTLTVDIWQGRFDELANIALSGGIDVQLINEIRNRPLSSGR